MSLAEHHTSSASAPSGITARAATAAEAARAYLGAAREAVSARVAPGGKVDAALLEREQVAAHGLAWTATYVETLTQLADYLARMESQGTLRQSGL